MHINILHSQHDERSVALVFPLIPKHTGIKIVPLTSLLCWKFINKSCWISVNVPADRVYALLCWAEMPACWILLSQAGGRAASAAHSWPSTACCCQGNGAAFYSELFFKKKKKNWINWSNRRLSSPPCHAFYLSLIAPSLPASLCLPPDNICAKSLPLQMPPYLSSALF